jgi:signal transduction histidine kinase
MTEEKPTVLYVDDVPMNLKLFEATFRNDYQLILTEYPGDVLNILREKEVQVVVSDQRMPEMTGTELLEKVAEEFPDTRRYLLTAYTDTETVIEAVNRGRIHGYIKKPMQPDAIRQSINNSLEVYHLRKKNREIMEELEIANRQLLRMDGLKSEIIHSITKEISMPLSRIMGTLHLLKNKIEGEYLADAVNILDQSVFKLEQFSLLARQISVLKSPGYKLKRSLVSLKQVIQFSAIETNDELREQRISLKRELSSPEAQVTGDSALLVSCLVSMIQFAREHTQVGGEIEVNVEKVDGGYFCCVCDQGANYTDSLREMLTGHFSRGERDLNLQMGIGLAHSQMIMEVHGGNIVFERFPDDRGCLKMVFPNGGDPLPKESQ